jgi:hypothetical protein
MSGRVVSETKSYQSNLFGVFDERTAYRTTIQDDDDIVTCHASTAECAEADAAYHWGVIENKREQARREEARKLREQEESIRVAKQNRHLQEEKQKAIQQQKIRERSNTEEQSELQEPQQFVSYYRSGRTIETFDKYLQYPSAGYEETFKKALGVGITLGTASGLLSGIYLSVVHDLESFGVAISGVFGLALGGLLGSIVGFFIGHALAIAEHYSWIFVACAGLFLLFAIYLRF